MNGPPGTNALKPILWHDVWRVRNCPPNDFQFVFDIGANVGFFSLQARVLFPRATIVAIEPDPTAFPHLRTNMEGLDVRLENVGIGDGNPAYFGKREHPLSALITPQDWTLSEVTTINTVPFSFLFHKYGCKISNDYMLKSNIEGAEKYFIQDPGCQEIFKNAKEIGMMVHFKSPSTPYEHWLDWQEYDNWLRELLGDTHIVEYYHSNKKKGKGHYYARKKGT